MSNWRAMADNAADAARRGDGYREAGVLRTAARYYRTAADLLDQAALIRSTEIGETK